MMAVMEDSKLIFSLDCHDEGPTVAFSKDGPPSRESRLSLSLGTDFDRPPRLPHSPSSPGSLADLAGSSESAFITTNLVKSCSTDLEPRESGSVKSKPLLSLVKSLSTEISRRGEPDVNLSKSDSKLHLHPWRQLTQPKISEAASARGEDDGWMSPPSPTSLALSEPRSSSLMMELEDTGGWRKFSEAMQDPLSMLSKIIGDESSGSTKLGRTCAAAAEPPYSSGGCGREGSWTSSGREDGAVDGYLTCRRRNGGEYRDTSDSPLKKPHEGSLAKMSADLFPHRGDRASDVHSRGGVFDDCRQVLSEDSRGTHGGRIPRPPLPLRRLFCLGLLAYGFFVLPLPSYMTGLSVGIACGFVLGLAVVYMCAPQGTASRRNQALISCQSPTQACPDPTDGEVGIGEVLEGWMNETHNYDPETYHPSVTHSVYATLEGSALRLEYPRTNVPRWATFKETLHVATFVRSHTYQLADCKVSLLPSGLARKRLWNKKYPICLTLAQGEVGEVRVVTGQEEEKDGEDEETAEGHTVPGHQLPVTLYLFGRTGREKEEWYQHFLRASSGQVGVRPSDEENTGDEICGRCDSVKDWTEDLPGSTKSRTLLDYRKYMRHLIGRDSCNGFPSPCHSENEIPTAHTKQMRSEDSGSGGEPGAESPGPEGSPAEGQPTWVNSLVGRILWDFLREKYWTDQVAHKIQKKLTKIRLPYFMNELILADLDMGTCLPQVLCTSKPSMDRRGLWLELEVVYTGCLQMTLETKMNLVKLGKEGEDETHSVPDTQQLGSKPRLCILADSDEESSSAGSSDEEELPPSELHGHLGDKNTSGASDGHAGGSTGRKILRFVDKIAKSKYFQRATENEYIKKKIAEVSNMPLMLSVEVLELSGPLAVNIPPPPTDRIWYSFRVPPKLDLHVRPMLGEREVTFTHVTEWIERKLQCEFQKVFVMPNMDDLYLPLMTSGLENPSAAPQSPAHSTSHQSSMDSQEYLSE